MDARGCHAVPRYYFTATSLPDGRVLVAGGFNASAGALSSVEVYDPGTGSWRSVERLISARFAHAEAVVPGGRVLEVGGFRNGTLATAEIGGG